ncbi:MAG: glycosyltransferase family 4 protein [Nitrospinae bacterium]|nr:glycosyltransferase family 4 protein [Nitrospinota bacterium]
MNKVCVVAYDPIGPQMAGPAIRSLELARTLGRKFDVTLAVPNNVQMTGEPFKIFQYNYRSLRKLVQTQEVVCVFGFHLKTFPFLKKIPGALVVDIYCPTFFEALANYGSKDMDYQIPICRRIIDLFQEQLRAGDFFICASEIQRDFWVGMLVAAGRVNPYTFGTDKTLRSLIDVVPYGLPENPPAKKQNVLKGVHPAIKPGDKVVLWGGGMYDWLDPKTAVRAMEAVSRERPDIKLFFMGCLHPLPNVRMDVVKETKNLSDSLGLTGKTVLFNDHWISYDDRADYLLEADIGLSLHQKSIETDYSFRTRIMDYLWAGIPILSTRGGALSDLVEEKRLGLTAEYNDPQDLSRKILQMAAGEELMNEFRENIRDLRSQYVWGRALEPLERFCRSPAKKIDDLFAAENLRIKSPVFIYKRARSIYKSKGLSGLAVKTVVVVANKIQHMLMRLVSMLVPSAE